ncbi:hypothetical protein XELAEV_18022978mg [Xenopus laevis]|uniref:LRRC8 pannexin-like TM region domain-containing protein n=1 Tax=Xenopus laevis TaxID=8355 RepID=A0A974D5Z2_XENLA|nr:hypothetical protein XELAEV_18022978mg [Xenopus laevis]
MIPIGEFRQFSEVQPAYRVLKPWWDVFMDYLSVAMLMIGVFGCTLQIMQIKIICLPKGITNLHSSSARNESNPLITNKSATPEILEMKGLKTNLDFQQYSFINQMCYEVAIHWYTKYFPYLVLLHTLIFLLCSNFWFKFPGSCSKIEHFISILWKCFDSLWTTSALYNVSDEGAEDKITAKNNVDKSYTNHPANQSPLETSLFESSIRDKAAVGALDKKEREQAKALFEKVKNFRHHVEGGILLYTMYTCQTILKVINFLFIIGYNSALTFEVQFTVLCNADLLGMTGYKYFYCNRPMAFLFSKLSFCYLCIVGLYGFTCFYTIYWLFYGNLKEYSFEHVRQETGINDIPDVRNDLAFMFHIVDRYDPLFSKRVAIFLSETSENKLKQLNLNKEWNAEKLRQRLQTNACNLLELKLCKIPGLPDAIFEITELQSLRLENINNVMIPATVAQLNNLQALFLLQCTIKLHTAAFTFLKEHLQFLKVIFDNIQQIPLWMYSLSSLEELYLICSQSPDIAKSIMFESFKNLTNLKHLFIKSQLSGIPQNVADISLHLQRLSIHNDGIKLVILNNLKKMVNVRILELIHCNLGHIPHSIFSLHALKELDLKRNNLRSIQEIASFEHLHNLTILKLWHNKITKIPDHINKLTNLEQLNLSHNNIREIPYSLFLCLKLRYLDLSCNEICIIPPRIGKLQSLKYFSINCNKVERIPNDLFLCKELETLNLGENNLHSLSPHIGSLEFLSHLDIKGNPIGALPPELGCCKALKISELIVEDNLFEFCHSLLGNK